MAKKDITIGRLRVGLCNDGNEESRVIVVTDANTQKFKLTFHRRLGSRTARCSFRRMRLDSYVDGRDPGSETHERESREGLSEELPREEAHVSTKRG